MSIKSDNVDDIKTAKVRVTRLEETGVETYYFDLDTATEVKCPKDIEVE